MMLTKDFPMTGPQRQNHNVHIFFFRNNISILVYSAKLFVPLQTLMVLIIILTIGVWQI